DDPTLKLGVPRPHARSRSAPRAPGGASHRTSAPARRPGTLALCGVGPGSGIVRAMTYDLVVVGGGPAGEKAAAAAAFFGKKTALVERDSKGPGGSTVHTGTLPSKTLRETALYLTGFRRGG